MQLVGGPQVFCIAQPEIRTQEMLRYLEQIGGEEWYDRVVEKHLGKSLPPAEGLIEFMGRLCYKSWEPKLNRNVMRIREDRGEYIKNILKSAHGSVLAHAHFSFAIHDCSRVLTAELNRHAAGTDISEQSLRFVRLDNLRFWWPEDGLLSEESNNDVLRCVNLVEATVAGIYERELNDEMPFDLKKKITSRIRRIAPLGLATEEGWTANIRAIRHVITMRSDPHAEEEIRMFADALARRMMLLCPLLFQDFSESMQDVEDSSPPHWVPEFPKV